MLDLVIILQLFILVNPLSSLCVLISAHKNKLDIRKIAANAVVLAFLIAVAIVFLGPWIFQTFGIDLNSFKIAGGIVLFLLGLETIKPNEVHDKVEEIDGIISVLATPLLTGPATISYITIKTYEVGQTIMLLNVAVAFVIISLVFISFAYAIPKTNHKLIDIVSRVFGLFLSAVAVDMVASGLAGLIKKF